MTPPLSSYLLNAHYIFIFSIFNPFSFVIGRMVRKMELSRLSSATPNIGMSHKQDLHKGKFRKHIIYKETELKATIVAKQSTHQQHNTNQQTPQLCAPI